MRDGLPAQRLVGDLTWEHQILWPYFPPIATQQFQQLGGEWDVAILMAFTQLEADHHTLAVDVACAQMHGLTYAHPGTVHGDEDDMAMKGRRGLEQLRKFLRA